MKARQPGVDVGLMVQGLKLILEETFLRHRGMFTNRDSLVHPDRPPADWAQSWVVRSVTDEEWAGLLGILAHNAFHLGAVRELLTPRAGARRPASPKEGR